MFIIGLIGKDEAGWAKFKQTFARPKTNYQMMSQKPKTLAIRVIARVFLELVVRLELTTCALRMRCSTN